MDPISRSEHHDAVERVLDIFKLAAGETPPFPATELYSEGWMLRLLMDSHIGGQGGLPVPLISGSWWYSEARLSSPFQRSRFDDPLAETETHADGVIGHFLMRAGTKAGLQLMDGGQLVVIEAKMGSRLSSGTRNAPCYDQAVRNVAAMAWTIHSSSKLVSDLQSVAFLVMAPQAQLDRDPTFASYLDRQSLLRKFDQRLRLYQLPDPARYRTLKVFQRQVFDPLVEVADIRAVSWEGALAQVHPTFRQPLADFYAMCLFHNRVETPSPSA